MFLIVSGRDLYTDTCLPFRYNGVVETGYIDAFFLHAGCINLRQFGIIQHYCANGTLGRLDVETGSSHLVAEVIYIFYQLVVQGVAFFQHLEYFKACTNDARSQGVGEEIRTAALAQQVDNLFAARGETAQSAAEGFAQCTGVDVHTSVGVVQFAHAMSRSAHYSGRVGFVHHYQCIILFGKVAYLVHGSYIAVHGEHAVRYDDAETLRLSLLQAFFKLCHVGIGITVTFGFAEAHAVDDGSMVQGIGDDGVLFGEERLEHTAVGIEAGGI